MSGTRLTSAIYRVDHEREGMNLIDIFPSFLMCQRELLFEYQGRYGKIFTRLCQPVSQR